MADGIAFNTIPASGLTAPIMSFEVNSGGQYDAPKRFILAGHKTSAGTMPFSVPIAVYDQATIDGYAGPGSMLREMARIALQNGLQGAPALYILAVAENGIAPVWTWTVGALPGVGVGTVDICGEEIDIPVTAADTPATIAAALAGAINAYYDPLTKAMLPITAAAAGAVITMTGRHAAAVMNEVDFFVPTLLANNLFAVAGVLSLAQTTPGAGVPVVSPALNALGDDPADFIVSPWSDSGSLAAYTAALSDLSGRWAWNRQSYGHAWTAAAAGFSALTTLGLSLNDRHTSIIPRVPSVAAMGSIAFASNPAAGTTLTVGSGSGTAVTFVAANPAGNQVLIGANLAATLAALQALLQASSDVNLAKCGYAVSGSTLQVTAGAAGTGGNGYGLATTVAGVTLSGQTLSGGLDGCPEPSWLWAAGLCARVAPWLSDIDTGNVSRNQTGLVVQGLHPPRSRGLVPNYAGRNTLANSGISTWRVGPDGSVQVDKIVTTYRVGASGQPDAVFRDIQALYQVSGGLGFMRAQVAQDCGQKAIAPANPGSLGALVTPSDVKASFIHAYGTLVNKGVFADLDTYTKTVTVQIDGSGGVGNPARVNVYNPMQRVNPLDVLAANTTIYQQFPQTAAVTA